MPAQRGLVRCSECRRQVDERTAISEWWGYWSDGAGELVPFCPTCARREFAPDAPASDPGAHLDRLAALRISIFRPTTTNIGSRCCLLDRL